MCGKFRGIFLMSTVFFNVEAGKRKREDLKLPILHFAVADGLTGESWIETLGHRAFCAWLTLHTLVDRTDQAEAQYNNRNTVPRSLESLAKDIFKCDKKTFYNKVVKPLWNYGLIDVVEWKEHKKIGQKAHNIIVYHYPQNEKTLETQPLIQIRDYNTDYSSAAKIFADKRKNAKKAVKSNRGKNSTVKKYILSRNYPFSDRGKNSTVTVEEIPQSTVEKIPHSNSSNTWVNGSNTHINVSNSLKSSSSKREEPERKNNDDEKINESYLDSLFQQAVTSDSKSRDLAIFLNEHDVDFDYITEIIAFLFKDQISFNRNDAAQQLEYMFNKMKNEPINNFVAYFVNGLKLKSKTIKGREKFESDIIDFWSSKSDFKQKDEHLRRNQVSKDIPGFDWLEEANKS